MTGRAALAPIVLAASVLALLASPPALAQRPEAGGRAARAPSGTGGGAGRAGPARAPSPPPLNAPAVSGEAEEEDGGTSVEADSDPLVSNGLGSPLCRRAFGAGALSSQAARNCSTSGFVASAAPTGNYGLDVHVDTGVLGVDADSAVQDVLVSPVWMAIVWVVHALCVMLEWCFTLDLLDSSAAGGVGGALREMQATLTQPWLATVLSIACVLVLYDGLIRRRVAETLGQALLMLVMIAGGMWAIVDPTGTVGALGRWANQASLGTLGVAARGTPERPAVSLGESMRDVFTAAVEVPWCYLEFGNVGWCRDPSRLDPALRAAGLKIATKELGEGGQADAAVRNSAELLREARSNGAIFLALPANGPARNSINDEGSLLRTLCGSSEATDCRGATAAEAEFRTGGQTWSRMGGLLLIAVGALGMVLLLAFIALRLLGAALFSLLFLLMAPGMVLAPALGDGGRAVFRRWLGQLLGAVVAKLLFSFLLGVVFAVLAILAALTALGWWTQWLLMSAFWWGAFLRRHHALGLAESAFGSGRADGRPRTRSVTGRVSAALETRKGVAAARWARQKTKGQRPPVNQPADRADKSPSRSRDGGRPDPGDHTGPGASTEGAGAGVQGGSERERLERIRREGATAESGADTPRSAEPPSPAGPVEAGVPDRQGREQGAPREELATQDHPARDRTARGAPREDPARPGPPTVAGRELEAPDPVRRREARLEIDREIDLQKELSRASGEHPAPEPGGEESEVMRDAREVEAGRKRQLGRGRP